MTNTTNQIPTTLDPKLAAGTPDAATLAALVGSNQATTGTAASGDPLNLQTYGPGTNALAQSQLSTFLQGPLGQQLGESLGRMADKLIGSGGDLATGDRVYITRDGFIFDQGGNLMDKITPPKTGYTVIPALSRNGHPISISASGDIVKSRESGGYDILSNLNTLAVTPTELNGVIQNKGRTPIATAAQIKTEVQTRANQATATGQAARNAQLAAYYPQTHAISHPRGANESVADWVTRLGYQSSMPPFIDPHPPAAATPAPAATVPPPATVPTPPAGGQAPAPVGGAGSGGGTTAPVIPPGNIPGVGESLPGVGLGGKSGGGGGGSLPTPVVPPTATVPAPAVLPSLPATPSPPYQVSPVEQPGPLIPSGPAEPPVTALPPGIGLGGKGGSDGSVSLPTPIPTPAPTPAPTPVAPAAAAPAPAPIAVPPPTPVAAPPVAATPPTLATPMPVALPPGIGLGGKNGTAPIIGPDYAALIGAANTPAPGVAY